MLIHPTLDQLNSLGLQGMAKAFNELAANDEAAGLAHADWLALLLEREAVHRQDKRLGARLRHARLRHHAVAGGHRLPRPRAASIAVCWPALVKGDWIDAHDNLVITGPTGVGKSWLACALGHKACRDNRSVLYVRVPKLFDELALAHGDGSAGRRPQEPSAPPSCSSSTTGAWSPSAPRPATTCWRSSKTATAGDPPSSPASCRSPTGTPSSARPPTPTPSSTASSTTPTASTSAATSLRRSAPPTQA